MRHPESYHTGNLRTPASTCRVFGVALALLSVLVPLAHAGDWGRFRGPSGTGISNETAVPLIWGPAKNVKWRAPLPGPGNSSPIVSRDRVFVTVATDEGKYRSLYCFDRDDGHQLWVRTVEFNGEEPTHATNPYCGPSPASDGSRVVVWHSSAGLYCYDFDGNELWARDLGKFVHIWGYGSSPVLHQGKVLLNCGPGERTFVTALDSETGETLWQVDEPGGTSGLEKKNPEDERAPWIGSWSTPLVTTIDEKEQVVVSMPYHVQGYDLETGEILWKCRGLGDLVYTDPLISEGIGVAMGGYHGPAIGFRLGGHGDVTETDRLWQVATRNPQRIGSGVIVGDYIYMANESGVAQCIELATGKEVWKDRFSREKNWGSIIAADGRLYVTNKAGDTIVFAPNPERFEELAVNSLGERSNSTPAISGGQVFLRTFEAVYCIEQGP